jgi:hypothetical protein
MAEQQRAHQSHDAAAQKHAPQPEEQSAAEREAQGISPHFRPGRMPPQPPAPAEILRLQRTLGNRSVGRFIVASQGATPRAAPANSSRVTPPAAGSAASTVIQAKRYTVSRNLPLETHYTLREGDKAKDILLGKLRLDYPLDSVTEETANRENWSGEKRDAERGEAFLSKKREILREIAERGAEGVWVPGAHVAGLSVLHERERREGNKVESALTKKVTKSQDWIGAHLIKREWGGEDNMWNVVSWPKAAEAEWGEHFEEPIEVAFANKRERKVDINVEVEKEDEVISPEEVKSATDTAIQKIPVPKDDAWVRLIHEEAAKAKWELNRGVESVPVKAAGASKLGTANLAAGKTGWTAATDTVLKEFRKRITSMGDKAPHPKRLENVKGKEAIDDEQSKAFGKEREDAWKQETTNYRPERYEGSNDLL